ncbi:MAG: hypothetical protein WKF43_13405 [Acidimicrobiales bacterium]
MGGGEPYGDEGAEGVSADGDQFGDAEVVEAGAHGLGVVVGAYPSRGGGAPEPEQVEHDESIVVGQPVFGAAPIEASCDETL